MRKQRLGALDDRLAIDGQPRKIEPLRHRAQRFERGAMQEFHSPRALDGDIDAGVGEQAMQRDLAAHRQRQFSQRRERQRDLLQRRRQHRALCDGREARAAALDEPDAHLTVLARCMEGRAPAPLAPGRNGRLHLRAAQAALGKRLDHLLALPGEVRRLAPMLQLAAAAAAEMAAGGRPGAPHSRLSTSSTSARPPAMRARTRSPGSV